MSEAEHIGAIMDRYFGEVVDAATRQAVEAKKKSEKSQIFPLTSPEVGILPSVTLGRDE